MSLPLSLHITPIARLAIRKLTVAWGRPRRPTTSFFLCVAILAGPGERLDFAGYGPDSLGVGQPMLVGYRPHVARV